MRQYWNPPKLWPGKTVFIIGGGPSLKNMSLKSIHDKRVIGCNDAYELGNWIDVCYFGDYDWFERFHRGRMRSFPGLKVTLSHRNQRPHEIEDLEKESILLIEREPRGLILAPGKIGWNCNTGASAINLAVLFGAKRIVLLGFDMKLNSKGQANWHDNPKDSPDEKAYARFMEAFEYFKQDMDKKVPDVEVVNATPGSKLDLFPKVKLKDEI